MPQPVIGAWWIVVGVVGVAAVGLWALCGRDAKAAARSGSRWKRAVLAAGLSVLAAVGWTGRASDAREPAAVAGEATDDASDESQVVLALFRMRSKLAELAKLTASSDINGLAVTETADTIDSLAAVLGKAGNVARLTPKGQAEAARLLALAKARVPAARALAPVGTTDLAKSPQWQIVVDAWRYAGPLATTGQSTNAQRKEADEKFKVAKKVVSNLMQAGLLSAAEAGLLTMDAARLRTAIYRNPPTDSRVKCYDMAFMPPARASFTRLQQQMGLLKTIIAAKRLAPAVLDTVLATVEQDLAILADPKQTKYVTGGPKAAEALRKEMLPLVAKVKRRVLAERLGQTAGWAKVEGALAFGEALGERSATAKRKEFDGKLAAATAALAALSQSAAITDGESTLLKGELERVRVAVYRRPPIDTRKTCYKMAYTPPARLSASRLKARVAILKTLSESGRLNPVVLAKVLPTVRADVKLLGEEKELARLGKGRAEAEALRKQVEPLLAAIEKQLGLEAGK